MDSKVTLRVEPTSAEVFAALWTYLPAVIAWRRRARMIFLASAVAMGVLAVVGTWEIWIPAIAVTGLAVYIVVRFQKRQLAATSSEMGLTDPSTVTADERGIRVETHLSDLWFDWANYQSIVETTDGVALVGRGGAGVRWIPARSFRNSDERQKFVKWAEAGQAISQQND